MGKIIRLRDVRKFVRPRTATLVGGVFDLFHVGHLQYLKDCSKLGRPLVVIVQTDRAAGYRKGFNRPVVSQDRRAEIVSALECVDFVLVLDKPSHYHQYLRAIQPKTFVFSKENMKYRLYRKRLIEQEFPKTKVVVIPKSGMRCSTSLIIRKVTSAYKRDYAAIRNPVARRLYELADKNDSRLGKNSALITYQGKIVAESGNNEKKELHAEVIAMREAKRKKIPLSKTKIHSLIPPLHYVRTRNHKTRTS